MPNDISVFAAGICGFSALPDRWSTWLLGAVPRGLVALYGRKIDVIFATFPIASAVLIGLVLHLITGKPLVVDFRDSMTEDGYPRDPRTRRLHRWMESLAIRHASVIVFTTESTRRMYLDRYPGLAPDKCVVIANGFDEEDFANLALGSAGSRPAGQAVRLVHAGVIYTDDRDPRCFFKALSRLKAEGIIGSHNLKIDLRASGSEGYYSALLQELNIQDLVHLLPALSHEDALQDLAGADGLLLFQAASCNHQIPAKVYEYFRFEKPVLALTNALGDTAALLKEVGGATISRTGRRERYLSGPSPILSNPSSQGHTHGRIRRRCRNYTRRNGAAELARQLDKLFTPEVRQRELTPVKD